MSGELSFTQNLFCVRYDLIVNIYVCCYPNVRSIAKKFTTLCQCFYGVYKLFRNPNILRFEIKKSKIGWKGHVP